MHNNLLCFIFIVFNISTVISVRVHENDYYWRDFNGEIPEDAFPAGQDVNGKEVYIAQIYVHDYGLYIGTIFQGTGKEIEFSCYGKRKTDSNSIVKILCTRHKENFSWLVSNAKNLHIDTIGIHAVVGGYNGKENGVYNIGRVNHDGSTQVGPINSYTIGTAVFFFVYKDKHYANINDFQVLVYNNKHVYIDERIASERK